VGELSDYIAGLDEPQRTAVERVRVRAVRAVPDAEEGLGYGMPALRYRGAPLLSVQAARAHIGLYPFSPAVVTAVADDLAGFSFSKGTIRFTPEHPLTDSVIDRIVRLRRAEIDAKTRR
jgi:uncharacterized protein YdhG (YjbR/CyaY superfamily)